MTRLPITNKICSNFFLLIFFFPTIDPEAGKFIVFILFKWTTRETEKLKAHWPWPDWYTLKPCMVDCI